MGVVTHVWCPWQAPARRTLDDFIDYRHTNPFQCLDDQLCGCVEADDNNDDDSCVSELDELVCGVCDVEAEHEDSSSAGGHVSPPDPLSVSGEVAPFR